MEAIWLTSLLLADALAHGELERLPDGVANRLGDAQRRLARARQVEIALVNRADLHVRREVVGIGKHQPGEQLVFLEIARQENQPGTQPARQGGGHRRVNAELARLIRGRGDDAALFPAHGDGFAAQPRVRRLLHRGEKGVGIQMHNRARGEATCMGMRKCCPLLHHRLLISSFASLAFAHQGDHDALDLQFFLRNEVRIAGIFRAQIRFAPLHDETS